MNGYQEVDHDQTALGVLWAVPWLVNQQDSTASFWTDLILTLGALSA
jgi:hypothetical protein